jgi:hypothetical protein
MRDFFRALGDVAKAALFTAAIIAILVIAYALETFHWGF